MAGSGGVCRENAEEVLLGLRQPAVRTRIFFFEPNEEPASLRCIHSTYEVSTPSLHTRQASRVPRVSGVTDRGCVFGSSLGRSGDTALGLRESQIRSDQDGIPPCVHYWLRGHMSSKKKRVQTWGEEPILILQMQSFTAIESTKSRIR